jgi:preprotein translocase subunit YajC
MSGVPALVLLQAAPGGPGGPGGLFEFLTPMAVIFLIFYFLVIRPQQRRQKEHEALLKGIERGDTVVTSGGLHGKVTGVTEDVLTVEIAQGKSGERIRVKQERSKIDRVEKAAKGAGQGDEGK